MTDPNKVATRNVSLLVGPETLDLYHNEICQNMGTLIEQAGTLKTAILELKKQLREHIATEQPVAQLDSTQICPEKSVRLD